jgi:hypothetical protein
VQTERACKGIHEGDVADRGWDDVCEVELEEVRFADDGFCVYISNYCLAYVSLSFYPERGARDERGGGR